jgi:hypothetical protein
MIFDLDQFTGPLDGGAGSEQGQEPSQVAAASLQAGDIGDLIREGKLLEVGCGSCRPARHVYIDAGSLGLPKRMSLPEMASHLVCSKCGARNSETCNPIWARLGARVGGVGHYPDFSRR